MVRRYFNWTLAVVLLVAVAVFAGAVFALHHWQRNTRAERALPQGEQAYAQGNWDEAADQLGRYLGVRGDDVAVLLKYADAQCKRRPLASGHIQQAVAAYQSVLRLDKNNAEAAQQLMEIYLAPPNPIPSEAERVAKAYVQNNDDPNVRRMLALAFAQQGRYSEAGTLLVALIKDHPDDIGSYEMLGGLARQRPADFNTPAADWYDRAVKANPQSARAYIARGAFHSQDHRRDQALAEFEQAAKCDLSNVDVHLRLVQELLGVQAVDKAKEHLKALQVKAPKEIRLWQEWAAVALSAGTAEEKRTVAETGLKELAAYPWDFLPTATELFIAANLPEKAQDCIARMREKGLQTGMLAFFDGLVAASKGNLWEATARWQDAIAQGHKFHAYAGGVGRMVVPVRMNLASAYSQLADTQSANVQLQTLVTENPKYADGRLALARLMARTRNWTGALEQAREVQQLVPGYAEAVLIELQARMFLLDDPTVSKTDRERGLQGIDKQLEALDKQMPDSVQVKLLHAQALSRQDKSAEAVKLLEEARSKYPSDLRATLLEVELLADQDKVPEAVGLLRGAIEKFPQAVEPVRTLAVLLNRQKNQPECESVIQQAIARMQPPESRRDLGLFLADLYRLWTREDDLHKWLMNMAGQSPNDVQVKRWLLTCPAVIKDVKQAQTLIDQIKTLEGPGGWQWRYEQAKIWVNPAVIADSNTFSAQYYTQATTFLQENLLANPNDQASRLLLAAAHERAGKQQLALAAYREAYSRTPNNLVVIMQTVAALQKSGKPAERDEADRILQEAANRQLDHPDLEKLELQGQRMRLQDQVRRGALDVASATLQELVRRDPNDVLASLQLAQICMQQGKLDQAEVILKGLETKAPLYIPVIRTRTQLYMLQGNAQEALRLCDETVQKTDQAAIAYLLRAWTYASLRENEKAAADLQQAVAKDPNNAGLWVDRASFYQSLGNRQEAIQNVRKALSLAGSQTVLERAIPLCLASGSRALIAEAEAALDKARARDEENPVLKLLKAQSLLRRGTRQSLDEGERLLREVTVAKPELSQAWFLLGRRELDQKQPGRALDMALGGLSHNERDRALLLLKAEAEAARSWALAVPTLRSLVTQYPNDVEIEMGLANALYRSGDKSNGRSKVEERIKNDPNNPIPVLTLISLVVWEKRWSDVTEQVKNWLGRHPDDVFVVLTTARSLMATGNAEALKTAESLLNAAAERNPKSTQVLDSLAMLMQSTERTAEAASLNRRVLELDPNDVIALNNLAWVLCEENKRYQDALEYAERGLKIAPDYADLLDTHGVALYRLGRYDKAAEDFVRCVELYPPDATSLVSAHFHLARAYAELPGQTAKAQEHIKQAMSLQEQTGGLSPADLAEAKALAKQLQSDH